MRGARLQIIFGYVCDRGGMDNAESLLEGYVCSCFYLDLCCSPLGVREVNAAPHHGHR